MKRTLFALAAAAAMGTAYGQDIDLQGSSVRVGIGHASGDHRDRARFGMYNGLRRHDTNLLLDFQYANTPEGAPSWWVIEGRNLALDNRELSAVYRRFGDFKLRAYYSEITRRDPRTINTSLQGAGTATPSLSATVIAPGAGQDLNLKLERKALGFEGEKWFSGPWQAELSFKNEEKQGSRFWGLGFGCSTLWRDAGLCSTTTGSAVLMVPEPVDSTIRQVEGKINFTGERLVLSAGYYGSFYVNNHGSLRLGVPAGYRFGNQNGGALLAADAGLNTHFGQPVALWPDNQAHQFSLAGNYRVTPKTRINFKYAYTHATQNESFAGMGLNNAPGGRSDLGGEINTTKAQVGFSAHPLEKLHLHGDLAYVEKKNKTPLDNYNAHVACIPAAGLDAARSCPGATEATRFYSNGNPSPKKWDAKVEASYKLTPVYTGIVGLKYEYEDFGTWTPTEVAGGISGLKQKLEEKGWRVGLRRVMSETFTGSVSWEQARRKGDSPWLRPVDFVTSGGRTGVTEVSSEQIYSRTAIFPFIYMDRERDKFRLMANWTPMPKLDVQVFGDRGIDRYHGPTEHGLRSFQMGTVSVDVSYAFSDSWKANAYGSRGRQTIDAGHSTGYDAIIRDTAVSLGFGVKGKPSGVLSLGADVMWIRDTLAYQQQADPAASAANATFLATSGGLPDVTYKLLRLNLYGEYVLQKNTSVRLDFIHHRSQFNEWTYEFNGTPYLYSDNTTLSSQQKQSVSFIGASFIYKFQ